MEAHTKKEDPNRYPGNEETICNNRGVIKEVLGEIAKKREFVRKYSIVKALVKNPNTYTAVAMKFLPRMMVKDLKDISGDKNVPQAIRDVAKRMHAAKRSR